MGVRVRHDNDIDPFMQQQIDKLSVIVGWRDIHAFRQVLQRLYSPHKSDPVFPEVVGIFHLQGFVESVDGKGDLSYRGRNLDQVGVNVLDLVSAEGFGVKNAFIGQLETTKGRL
jgi:hypothetical protein